MTLQKKNDAPLLFPNIKLISPADRIKKDTPTNSPPHSNNYLPFEFIIKNFGPIKKANGTIKPFTIILGKNNTGKSYLARLIYALTREPPKIKIKTKEHARHVFNKLCASLNNPQDFQTNLEKLFQEVSLDPTNSIKEVFSVNNIKDLILKEEDTLTIKIEFRFFSVNINWSKSHQKNNHAFITPKQKLFTDMSIRPFLKSLINKSFLIPQEQGIYHSEHKSTQTSIQTIIRYIQLILENYYPASSTILPASRNGLLLAFPLIISELFTLLQTTKTSRLKLNGDTIDFLKNLNQVTQIVKPRSSKNKYKKTRTYLKQNLLHGSIQLKQTPTSYQIMYTDEQRKQFKLETLSSMLIDIIPLFLFLDETIIKKKGLFVYEEPESHLHPEAQINMAYTLAQLQNETMGFILITNHSTFQLQAILHLLINNDQTDFMAVYETIPQEHGVNVTEIKITPEGLEKEPYLTQEDLIYNQLIYLETRTQTNSKQEHAKEE